MTDPKPLHRLFGLSWDDFFQETAFQVETEIDLSVKQQFLDLVIIRKGPEPLSRRLPDGFDELSQHNLVTFKSHHEALDVWALFELIGHYVNYRKQSSPSMQQLLPDVDFRMFAVSVRFPNGLDRKVGMRSLRPGVYEIEALATPIRIIVASQLPQEEQNAMLHLFSARDELVRYGREHWRPRSPESSTLLLELFKDYSEDPDMSEKLKEFARETIDKLVASMPAEELCKRLPVEARLKDVNTEEFRKRLPVEERVKDLSAEELFRALSPETLAALVRQVKDADPSKQ